MAAVRRSPSLVARGLEPLAASLWTLFLVWTALVAIVWGFGIGEVELAEWKINPDLRRALLWFLSILDPAWILFASVNVYRTLVTSEGLSVARRWALIVFATAITIAWISARFGLPLGAVHYTARLGAGLGPVPLALPLLWITILFTAKGLALVVLPRANQIQVSVLSGLLCLGTSLNLEPLAWKFRSWWLWYPGNLNPPSNWPPLSNYITWFLAGALFAWGMRSRHVNSPPPPVARQQIITFALLNAVFLATHLAQWMRG